MPASANSRPRRSTPSCRTTARMPTRSPASWSGCSISRSTPPRRTASRRWRRRSATCRTASPSICRPRPACSSPPSRASNRSAWRARRCGSAWKSRSATTSPRPRRSTTRWPSASPRSGPSASTIIWARKPSRTSWRCASAISSSSRSGTRTASTMCRSPSPRRSGWRIARAITRARARCATWCRTISSSCSRSSRWSRRAL